MLTIRLMRTGKKNQPSYKVVVTDKKNPPRGGKFVEEVGFFDPKTKEKRFNKERILHWLSVGAYASDTVHNMLSEEKVITEPKRKMLFAKKEAVETKAEQPKNETPAAAEAPAETEQPAEKTEPASEAPAEAAAPEEQPAPAQEAVADKPAESEEKTE
ncbi:MAG: 30S ribosomal protein S16 [Candidatus Pacebacteria bacterium]|nr:30S ribosomal protein S16 [Candidatus Paceibacterota bacterium]